MARPIPQPARAIFTMVGIAMKLKLMPSPQKSLEQPHAKRLARVHPTFLAGKVDTSINTWDDTVEGRGGPIPVRVYARPDLQPGAPAILSIHGGGFVDGGLDFTDNIQRGLAKRTGYVVIGISYRLAPEHPFPAALEDCEDVLQWMADTCPQGMDPTRIAVAGESAGGNLTAALAIATRDRGGPAISHQTIIYPFTDTTLTAPEWDHATMPGIKNGREAGELMVEMYCAADPNNPLVSVLHADLAGLPPAMVISCEHDPLKTDSIKYAEALKAAGVETFHRHYDNMPHGYLVLQGIIKEAVTSLDEIAGEITARLGAPKALARD
jgi:acetyl esterase